MADIDKQLEQTRRSIADFFEARQLSEEFTVPDKPFLLVLDEIGTLDQDGGKTSRQLDEVISHLEREYGVKVKVLCQSRDPQEKTAQSEYWQDESSTLRKHAFDKDFWHIRTEEAATRQALDWMQKGKVLGVIKYQDNLPEQETPKGVETMLRSQYKDNTLMHHLLARVGVRTGLLQQTKDIKSGHDIARHPEESLKSTIGGKAYGLGKLMHFARENPDLDIKVPEFSVLSIKYCQHELGLEDVEDRESGEDLTRQWQEHVGELAEDGKLRSVRSGAARSMPGMLHTVLNVGMTTQRIERELQKSPEAGRKALAQYSVLIESYQKAIRETSPQKAEQFENLKGTVSDILTAVDKDSPLNMEDIEDIRAANTVGDKHDKRNLLPDDAKGQYIAATRAVHQSWNSPSAQKYRLANDIRLSPGTAVIYQEMAEPILAGVVNSHNTANGDKGMCGDFGVQDSVVSGRGQTMDMALFAGKYPGKYNQLQSQMDMLFEEWGKPVEVEVTLVHDTETGEPEWRFLQLRDSSLTIEAQLNLCGEDLERSVEENDAFGIDTALSKINTLAKETPQTIVEPADATAIGHGDAVSRQAVAGTVVTPAEDLPFWQAYDNTHQKMINIRQAGGTPILVLDASDYQSFDTLLRREDGAEGAILLDGNESMHAAVAARSTGRACVVNPKRADDSAFTQAELDGQEITIGENGTIYAGPQKVIEIENPVIARAREVARTHPSLDDHDRADLDALLGIKDEFVKSEETIREELDISPAIKDTGTVEL